MIVFCETGLVVTPFLPGDSLLFAVGALAAQGMMNVRFTGYVDAANITETHTVHGASHR